MERRTRPSWRVFSMATNPRSPVLCRALARMRVPVILFGPMWFVICEAPRSRMAATVTVGWIVLRRMLASSSRMRRSSSD